MILCVIWRPTLRPPYWWPRLWTYTPRIQYKFSENDGRFCNPCCTVRHKVAVKLPNFWSDEPDLWFIHAESAFRNAQINQSWTKFDHVVQNLPQNIMVSVFLVHLLHPLHPTRIWRPSWYPRTPCLAGRGCQKLFTITTKPRTKKVEFSGANRPFLRGGAKSESY